MVSLSPSAASQNFKENKKSNKFNYEIAFTLAIAEATQAQLRARYPEQRVQTGVYKNREVYNGVGCDPNNRPSVCHTI